MVVKNKDQNWEKLVSSLKKRVDKLDKLTQEIEDYLWTLSEVKELERLVKKVGKTSN